MKYLVFILFFLPCACWAQTQADYEHVMARFVKYYNNKQGDSIIRMWSAGERDEWTNEAWGNKSLASMHKEYGKILSCKYIGIDTEDPNPGLAVFKTDLSVIGVKAISLTLEKGNYLGTFRFITSSDGINKLLKKKK
jgi:hypothetical protein